MGDNTGDGGQRGDSGDRTGLDSSDGGGDYAGDVGVGDASSEVKLAALRTYCTLK